MQVKMLNTGHKQYPAVGTIGTVLDTDTEGKLYVKFSDCYIWISREKVETYVESCPYCLAPETHSRDDKTLYYKNFPGSTTFLAYSSDLCLWTIDNGESEDCIVKYCPWCGRDLSEDWRRKSYE